MGRIAFVFSGQGDQFPGMGKDLYDCYSEAKEIFDLCDSIRPETSEQCFNGSEEVLKETKNTQPCLFATELAAAKVLLSKGIVPEAVAGFSLGEVVAATFAEVCDVKTGFELVCKRGEFMQSAAEKFETSMAAVVKLTKEQVEELCGKYENVYPVNFNCPGQITVSGLSSEMSAFSSDVKLAGGRAIPLKVKGAFHSPFMADASEAFGKELVNVELRNPSVKLYSNVTARCYGENISELLSKQICSPVRWEETVVNMIDSGIDTFIEIGPGKTLSNMIGKINSNVKTYSVSDISTILTEVCNA